MTAKLATVALPLLIAFAAAPSASAQTAVATFEELSTVLSSGQTVRVENDEGITRRGKVVTISPTEIVITRERLFRRSARDRFAKDAVTRVVYEDSVVNGGLLGTLAGITLTLAMTTSAEDEFDAQGVVWVYGPLFVIGGGILGTFIDRQSNTTIYTRNDRSVELSIGSLKGRGAHGVALRVTF